MDKYLFESIKLKYKAFVNTVIYDNENENNKKNIFYDFRWIFS